MPGIESWHQDVSTKDLAHHRWSTFSKHWLGYNETNSLSNTNRVHLNQVFANRSEDDEIYPLTVSEIAEAQKADAEFKHYFKCNAVFDKGLEDERCHGVRNPIVTVRRIY